MGVFIIFQRSSARFDAAWNGMDDGRSYYKPSLNIMVVKADQNTADQNNE